MLALYPPPSFRAETTRIMLNYGGIPFEDFVFQREQWAELKLKMPFGQVPVLEVSHSAMLCAMRLCSDVVHCGRLIVAQRVWHRECGRGTNK